MRHPFWLSSACAYALVALLAACKPSANAGAQVVGNPWQGEWSFADGENAGGFVSIKDCLADKKLCVLSFQTYGRKADDPSRAGTCGYGDPTRPSSAENRRAFKAEGKAAVLKLVTPWGTAKDCTLEMQLDDARQPPHLKADLAGSDCKSYCSGYATHFPADFTLRSRKPYRQLSTYGRVNLCYTDDSRAVQEWCTSEKLFALHQTWKLRQRQLHANSGVSKPEEWGTWQDGMLDRCKSASEPGRCIADAYEQQLRELDAQVYGRFLEQKLSAAQVLSALHPRFDPRTAKTGEQTDVNTKNRGPDVKGKLNDEMVVFFKITEVPFLPGHLLVLELVSDSFEGRLAKAFFSLLKAETGQLKVVAREPVRPSDAASEGTLIWYDERGGSRLRFDLANYRINDSERAFGYRLATWDGGTGADYGTENLVLHRLTPQGMKRILDVTMASDAAAWDNQEGKVTKDKKQRFVLIVSPHRHEGNHDWIIKGRIINQRSKRSRAAKAQTYIWRNGEYVLAGE